MVYHNKVAAAIKVKGKVLRESGDTVTLPYGSEYSILIKNLHSVRIQASVSIDGQNIADGTWFIIEPNSSVNLERYVKNYNYSSGNKFKFIERTKQIEAHRGNIIDDGLIRIEYKVERKREDQLLPSYYFTQSNLPRQVWYGGGEIQEAGDREKGVPISGGQSYNAGGLTRSLGALGRTACGAAGIAESVNTNVINGQCMSLTATASNVGITVPGTLSNQRFTSGAWFATELQTQVIVLRLQGEYEGDEVGEPVYTTDRKYCPTCGDKAKWSSFFCGLCGTALKQV